jgi:HprK-related kinase B
MIEPNREFQELRATYPLTSTANLRFLDFRLTLHSNDRRVTDAVTDYFAAFLDRDPAPRSSTIVALQGHAHLDEARLQDVPRPDGRPVKEAQYDTEIARTILKRRTGVAIYVGANDHCLVGDLVTNINQVVNAVNMVFMKRMMLTSHALLHASAVIAPGGRGIAIASASGAGKSTAALALLERGCSFVSNDRVMVRPGPEGVGVSMLGVPKKPRVNPGTLLSLPRLRGLLAQDDVDRYLALDPDALWQLEEKHDVDVESTYGAGSWSLTGDLNAIYMLMWRRGDAGLAVESVPAPDRLPLLRSVEKDLAIYSRAVGAGPSLTGTLPDVARTTPMYLVRGDIDIPGLADIIVGQAASR